MRFGPTFSADPVMSIVSKQLRCRLVIAIDQAVFLEPFLNQQTNIITSSFWRRGNGVLKKDKQTPGSELYSLLAILRQLTNHF